MTENQTNQPSPPTESDTDSAQHAAGTPAGTPKKRGRFATDVAASRRPVSPTAGRYSMSEKVSAAEPIQPEQTLPKAAPDRQTPATEQTDHAAPIPGRFTAGTTKPAEPEKITKTQSAKQPISAPPARPAYQRLPIDIPFERTRLLILAIVMIPLCIGASLPAWSSMVYSWWNTDDYSHGFLVIPATIFFLYIRRDSYPGTTYKLDWVGLSPILIYGVFRVLGGLWYMDILDHIAIWFWLISLVWFFYGWRVLLWALPSLCFLLFMFQLPWRVDVFMKNYLQQFAAHSAAIMLQTIGETAIPMTNTIRLTTMELGVEAACSGLRFLMSVFAIAFAAVLLLQRVWWQNVLILAVAAPLALFVNAVRIAIAGYLLIHFYEMVARWAGEDGNVTVVADEFAGKIAIALALGFFALFVWFLGKAFRRVEI